MAFRNELDALKAQNESLQARLAEAEERVARADRVLEKAEAREAELAETKSRLREAEAELLGPTGQRARDREKALTRARRLLGMSALALAMVVGFAIFHTQRSEFRLRETKARMESDKQELRAVNEALRREVSALEDEAARARTEAMMMVQRAAQHRTDVPDVTEVQEDVQTSLADPDVRARLEQMLGPETIERYQRQTAGQ